VRQACMLILPLTILLLCGMGHANEQAMEVAQRVGAIEEETNALEGAVLAHPTDQEMLLAIEKRIEGLKEAIETHETCVIPAGGRSWEQFLDDLDRRNGDQAM